MKALVVLSAGAGRGEHEAANEAVRRAFTAAGIEFQIYTAKNRDRVDNMVREHLAEGYDIVVAGGGDGTVSNAFAALLGTAFRWASFRSEPATSWRVSSTFPSTSTRPFRCSPLRRAGK